MFKVWMGKKGLHYCVKGLDKIRNLMMNTQPMQKGTVLATKNLWKGFSRGGEKCYVSFWKDRYTNCEKYSMDKAQDKLRPIKRLLQSIDYFIHQKNTHSSQVHMENLPRHTTIRAKKHTLPNLKELKSYNTWSQITMELN